MYKFNKKQSAYSLVELLISIALGIILTAAVIQAYLGTKRVSEVNAGVGRVQENARFSINFLREDIKNAGYSACIGRIRNKLVGNSDEFLSHNTAVLGWNADNTRIDQTFTLTGETEASGGNWNDASGADLPDYFNDQVIAGSDVISLKHYEILDTNIVTSDNSGGSITTSGSHNAEDGDIMLVGNCWQTELFQQVSDSSSSATILTASESGGTPGNRALPNRWLRDYSEEDTLFRYINTFYYVGDGAGDIPSLYRFQTSKPAAAITAADVRADSQELVEGVESLQVLYGEDTNDDLNPNRYVSADQVGVTENVVSVRIGLLLRSPDNASDINQADEHVLLDENTLNKGGADRILRYPFNSTIKLRNKGLNLALTPFTCNAGESGCI